jgi:hypothetical protein
MESIRHQVNTDGSISTIHRVVVHKFKVSDIEDPDLYAADPMVNWERSEPGKFVMKHSVSTPVWYRHLSFSTMGWQYVIIAELESKKLSEFYLRWGS